MKAGITLEEALERAPKWLRGKIEPLITEMKKMNDEQVGVPQ